ncbi:hypothetical protein BESB_043380 [Besnoitia besnoiti]|uniref:Uncharacterized protein n=1 Tax=Besnoitia besnoiti TaxID=94643 RepID=A0A2A9MJK1_BESBE|nr:hypothetical protein BESB_043380 [Besnoitia besnoiti]PFH36146.1 hypothetical protein BESB_043380 [Besnoitia besnoiti]
MRFGRSATNVDDRMRSCSVPNTRRSDSRAEPSCSRDKRSHIRAPPEADALARWNQPARILSHRPERGAARGNENLDRLGWVATAGLCLQSKGEERIPLSTATSRVASPARVRTGSDFNAGAQRSQLRARTPSRKDSCVTQQLAELWIARTLPPALKREIAAEIVQMLRAASGEDAVAGVLSPTCQLNDAGEKRTRSSSESSSCCSSQTETAPQERRHNAVHKSADDYNSSVSASTEWSSDSASEAMSEDEGNAPTEFTKEESEECVTIWANSPSENQSEAESQNKREVPPAANRAERVLESLESLCSILGEVDPVARKEKLDKVHAKLVGRDNDPAAVTETVASPIRWDLSVGEKVNKGDPELQENSRTATTAASQVMPRAGRAVVGANAIPEAGMTPRSKLSKLKADLRQHLDSLLSQVRLDSPVQHALRAGLCEDDTPVGLPLPVAREACVGHGFAAREAERSGGREAAAADAKCPAVHGIHGDCAPAFSPLQDRMRYHEDLEPLPPCRYPLETIMEDEEVSVHSPAL